MISKILQIFFSITKGQLISKADWRGIDSPKKRTDEFVLFAFLLFTANKSNSSVRFLGESTARQSAFRFYLTFSVRPKPSFWFRPKTGPKSIPKLKINCNFWQKPTFKRYFNQSQHSFIIGWIILRMMIFLLHWLPVRLT